MRIFKNLFGNNSKIDINEIYPLPFNLRKQNSRVENLDDISDDSVVLYNVTTIGAPFADWGICITVRIGTSRWLQIATRQAGQETALRVYWDHSVGYRGWHNL